MNPFVLYLLKVVPCSGVLLGYYWIALRNKTFHNWNRFYLLASVVLSLVAPLLKINISHTNAATSYKVFRILNVVTTGDEAVVERGARSAFSLTTTQVLTLAYAFVSVILLLIVAANAVRIFKILRSYPKTKLDNITFLATHAPGTPFSFLHYIVWNCEIDLHSQNGQQIFRHELVHVQQRHTWDKLFLLLILIPFWANPAFWIIRKELHELHEFTADEKALASSNAADLAQLILSTAFPQQQLLFTNPFFQSTIKRRIAMFTKRQHPTVSYISRIVALPLIVVVIAAFALKTNPLAARHAAALEKKLTVIIDAGHGGDEGGARQDAIFEKDIVLAIAKKIKAQNKNPQLQIVLTRESDVKTGLQNRVQTAADKHADLFLSIHVNAAEDGLQSGMEVVVPTKNPPYQQQSEVLGSVLVQELSNMYTIRKDLVRRETGVWVVDHNVCPAVLIECGYLTSKQDRDFLLQEENQNRIADKILDAIARYGVLKNMDKTFSISDTVPRPTYKSKPVTGVQYFEWPKREAIVFFSDGTKEAISVAEAYEANLFDSSAKSRIERKPWTIEKDDTPASANEYLTVRRASLDEAKKFKGPVMLNNKSFNGTLQQLPVTENEIAHISIIKGNVEELNIKPGDSALNVSTKAFIKANQRTDGNLDNEPLFIETEVEPKFPGDKNDWLTFLQKNLDANIPIIKGAKAGTYKVIVGFIVDVNGKVHDIKPVTKLGYGMEDEVVRLMRTSPDWIPALQNGKKVTAYKKQTITFAIAEGE